MEESLKQAILFDALGSDKVQCNLCSFRCVINEGEVGHCRVRQNVDGVLYSLVYDKVCSAGADPIEKKPLFHFMPGTETFSIATVGCNFQCDFCQNWQISQRPLCEGIDGTKVEPEEIVKAALDSDCESVAYTYTEPTIFAELAADTGKIAREAGLKNVFVSNGYMSIEAVDYVAGFLDAINIDLKAFSDEFYRKHCKAKLQPVLETIKYITKQTDIWIELTTLIIPGENDSDDELKKLANFISEEIGVDTPWHVSRFYPQYQVNNKDATPVETLERAYEIGKQAGLNYIYVGNLAGANAQSTFCHNCGELLIERRGYTIVSNNIVDSCCWVCKAKIAGVGL